MSASLSWRMAYISIVFSFAVWSNLKLDFEPNPGLFRSLRLAQQWKPKHVLLPSHSCQFLTWLSPSSPPLARSWPMTAVLYINIIMSTGPLLRRNQQHPEVTRHEHDGLGAWEFQPCKSISHHYPYEVCRTSQTSFCKSAAIQWLWTAHPVLVQE